MVRATPVVRAVTPSAEQFTNVLVDAFGSGFGGVKALCADARVLTRGELPG